MSRLLAVTLTAVCATAQAAAPPDRVSLLLHEGRECRRAGRTLAAEPALMEARNLCLDGRAQTAEFARV